MIPPRLAELKPQPVSIRKSDHKNTIVVKNTLTPLQIQKGVLLVLRSGTGLLLNPEDPRLLLAWKEAV